MSHGCLQIKGFIFRTNRDLQYSMGFFYFHGSYFLQKVGVTKTQRRICLESESRMAGSIDPAA